ncbi:TNF receptor-associated factor 5 [Holothuria leucospilota]|uniref:TNF receptor-associated factor 5 n=1 Tax=Holothuria leucospilota TaxID=206669 RepID=A0A9Q1H7D2_HOLLE|nr:TNF receptor-associated factor 5 [Holothuria leucospilota]
MAEPSVSDFQQWMEQTSEDERSRDVAECILRLFDASESLERSNCSLNLDVALMKRTLRDHQRHFQQSQNVIFQQEATIAALQDRVYHLKNVCYDGVTFIEIAGYRQKKYASGCGSPCIYSHDFYTERKGYRMCVQVNLNGDGNGKGTHLSVYIFLKEGPDDSYLSWPFQRRVTFTLLNQAGKDHFSDVFRPDPASPSFQKPVREVNIASGCPMFVAHKVIEDPEEGFLRNDTIAIKVTVHESA